MTKLLWWLAFMFALMTCGVFASPATAADSETPQTVWRLLDYMAVDYAEAVEAGQVINDVEYAEMMEFADEAEARLAALPPAPAKADLLHQADELKDAIAHKQSAIQVAAIARKLASELLDAYPVALAPSTLPDPAHGATLYAEHCTSCHGATGAGDGPASAGLDPAPIDFTDRVRGRERSLFALYQVIGQGLDGTSMTSFDHLSADDRWALAFHVGALAYTENEARQGERLWASDPAARAALADVEAVVQTTPSALAERIGEDKAAALTAYLRKPPKAARPPVSGSLAIAQTSLIESQAAYRSGDRRRAADLALSAYLDGFEPVEPALAARDGALMRRIETVMIDLRASISRAAPVDEVDGRIENALTLLDDASAVLSARGTNAGASFVGALTVLIREGLEALLIVVAMLAFARKAERPEVLPYVHGGWIAALAGGALTWAAATFMFTITGATREITEGIGSVFAAIVLVTVGIWMHGKSQGDAWQKYISEKMSRALSRRSSWFLFLLAFVVVYREVFETILFFLALWSQGDGAAILAGAGFGAVVLAGIAVALLRFSRRLPIARFFSLSSMLIAVLAIVLVGKGIAALQEAGWVSVAPIKNLPRIDILGFYPTWQSIAAQLATLAVLVFAFSRNRKTTPTA